MNNFQHEARLPCPTTKKKKKKVTGLSVPTTKILSRVTIFLHSDLIRFHGFLLSCDHLYIETTYFSEANGIFSPLHFEKGMFQ